MQFFVLPVFLASTALAAPAIFSPRTTNTCFDNNNGVCLGRQANITEANIAIAAACAKVPSCTPGVTNHGRSTVTGKATGSQYTATLYVGDQCAGWDSWSQDCCIRLFNDYVDTRCEEAYPAGDDLFQLGYLRAPCDNSLVSFNFGG